MIKHYAEPNYKVSSVHFTPEKANIVPNQCSLCAGKRSLCAGFLTQIQPEKSVQFAPEK